MIETARVTECGLRDGLQSLGAAVPTERKVAAVRALVDAGVRRFDLASFVDPRRVPAMADAEALLATVPRVEGVHYGAFVPNLRGLERALAARVNGVGVAVAATETFNRRNLGCGTAEALARAGEIAREARTAGTPVAGVVACCAVCPFEGPVAPEFVADLIAALVDAGCEEVGLGETIGRARPPEIARLLEAVLARVSADALGVHFHDTFGQGIANYALCIERGIRRFDGSFGGLGGCPFAPGAAGNVATEELLYLLEGYGIATGIDAAALARAGAAFCAAEGLPYRAKTGGARS